MATIFIFIFCKIYHEETWIYIWNGMVSAGLECMNNADFAKTLVNNIAYRFHFSTSMSSCGIHFDRILRR